MKIVVEQCTEETDVMTPFQDGIDIFMDCIDVSANWDDKAHDKFQKNVVERCKEKVDRFIENGTLVYRTMKAALIVGEKLQNECTKAQFSGLQTVESTVKWVRDKMYPPTDFIDKLSADMTEGNVDGAWEGAPFLPI